MFVGIDVNDKKEYTFYDTIRVWKDTDYGNSWGLSVNEGVVFFFSSFSEMLMFLANQEKLWLRA